MMRLTPATHQFTESVLMGDAFLKDSQDVLTVGASLPDYFLGFQKNPLSGKG